MPRSSEMGIDFIVEWPCIPKETFGEGNVEVGTQRILDAKKAKDRAETLARLAAERGEDINDLKIVVKRFNAITGEEEDTPVTHAELQAEAATLEAHASHCEGCPANFRNKPYGCVGFVNYPIPPETENWGLHQLQTPDTFGGFLMLQAIEDFGYTGEPIEQYRKAGLLSSDEPPKWVYNVEGEEPITVTTSQIFHGILCVGEELSPGHIVGVLCWFGAIEFEGRVLTTPEDAQTVLQLETVEERQTQTAFALESVGDDSAAEAMHSLIHAMYLCWVLDVPLWLSA